MDDPNSTVGCYRYRGGVFDGPTCTRQNTNKYNYLNRIYGY